ncbi:DEAD/DEAH box helicase family protein [Pelagibacteraceae bacterium]|nr:DEAD/DEAH box helicase family protein [Pelagibacteraceae bacterium]
MSIPNTYLELLQTKVMPNTQTGIQIRFNNRQQINDSNSVENNEKLNNNDEPVKSKPFTILDKRRSSTVNRDIVLDKLRKQDVFAVKPRPSDINKNLYVPRDLPEPVLIDNQSVSKLSTDIVISEDVPIEEEKDEKEREDDIFDIPSQKEIIELPEEELEDITRLTELEEPAKFVEEVQEEKVDEIINEPKKRGRKPKKIIIEQTEELPEVDLTTAVIRTQKVVDRLPKEREKNIIVAPPYYMNNRKLFIQKLNKILQPREQELLGSEDSVSCDRGASEEFSLLTHQRIVRDYLNLYTPYRGLLLYHGLGSGKTCTSIAIAEGMKSNKQVFVLTPASLKMNFFSEMKKCGDDLYKKNQYWEFISIEGNPEYLTVLSKALSLPIDYVRKNKGAWLVNINKEPNFSELSSDEKTSVDLQLNEMIRSKYKDINYNGLNMNILNKLTDNQTRNPFDNAVVIIDEAHNFVSRIVNKIKQKNSISYILYDYLMKATNVRIVLLSGTPIINYTNEIGILYNILRGYIKTWNMTVNVQTSQKVDTNAILDMFDKAGLKTHDFVEYSGNKLTITRNPFGFVNTKKRGALKGTQKRIVADKPKTRKIKGGSPGESFQRYDGVKLDESGNITDADFLNKILQILKKNGLDVQEKTIELTMNKCLPDVKDDFLKTFVNSDTEQAQNINLFQRRILGLTSYFRSAQENLLPSFVTTDKGDNYHIVYNEMTDHQFGVYTKIRKEEADREKAAKTHRKKQQDKEDLFSISSTYRIFSRAACNFVFPDEIERPIPTKNIDKMDENDMDALPKDSIQESDPYANVDDEIDESSKIDTENYAKRIENALSKLNTIDSDTGNHKYLTGDMLQQSSPKFLQILENLTNPDNIGSHLIYSHFRTMEGIGILRLILLANGFAEFKIKKSADDWEIVEDEKDAGKPKFVLYTGTETPDEREIIRNVYNGAWDLVPVNIANKLREQNENNMYGDVIKIFMITSSGAEGINLKNTRYVHIVEPYWHMVRPDQVVGRARRICSHQDLPEELRTVQVFLYVTKFSKEQKTDDKNIEIRIRDVSRIDKATPVTTDETLYEIASIKQRINNQILQAVKETAIDCNIYARTAKSNDNPMVCYGYGKIESNVYSSYPSFEMDKMQKEGLDVARIQWDVQKVNIQGQDYVLKKDTMELYDYNSYNDALINPNIEPKRKGKLIKVNGQFKIVE